MYVIIVSIVLCILARADARIIDNYNTIRTKLLEKELELQVGGNLQLSDEEVIANDIIMRLKRKEVSESFEYQHFDFSRHYFMYKNEINKSKVYQIIKKMPKGAALHVHSSLMLSADRLLDLTYEEHLYACLGDNFELQFSTYAPLRPCPHKWQLLSDLRNTTDNIDEFDSKLKKHFTLYSENEKDRKHDINLIWTKFNKVYHNIKSLISYRPVREKFFYYALKEFYDDNIMYLEIRSGLSPVYELNGTVHDVMKLPHLYYQVAEKFKKDHPDFVGVKLIVTRSRSKNISKIKDAIKAARSVKREIPDFFAGFDLVGQEDVGKPLLDFHSILEDVKSDMNFYFHGGETNWYGTSSDENLIDAILLGSKRIGHGYALIKHPSLMATVREKDIAIEVNVISNVVLSLLCDVRNHPLAAYLALGMPVVLSSDDPGVWGADPLSHDFYVAFLGVASKRADLRMLKQLVINSVKYSALGEKEKTVVFTRLNNKWNKFIKSVIDDYRQDT